jgi:hypothetical protein
MANLVVDGFDWFPSGQASAVRDRLWAADEFYKKSGGATADVETGRFGFGKGLLFSLGGNSAGHGYVVPIGATPATGFFGCAMFIYPDQTDDAAPVLQFFDAVNNVAQFGVFFAPNGVIKIYPGNQGTGGSIGGDVAIANSKAGVYQENEWFHVEIKGTIANSGGSVEVRINTVPVIQLVGADTQNSANAYFDAVAFNSYKNTGNFNSSTIHTVFDDFFVNDTSGAQNNDWLGNVRVKTQFMIANGATNNFSIGGTSPAATHWQSVLNQLLDDSKFEFSSTIGDIDLFTPDPNLNSPLVHALQVRMGLRQDDATQRVARALLRIGSTLYPGTVDQYTNQTFTFYKERFELNPATGVSFSGADVNGLQPGVKVQA